MNLLSAMSQRLSRIVRREPALVTLIGHSHLWAMGEAVSASSRPVRVIDFWKHCDPFSHSELGMLDEILEGPLRGPVVSVIGRSCSEILTLYKHPRPFDFILPHDGEQALAPGAEIIPFEAVRGSLLGWMQPGLDLMAGVRARTQGAMYHLTGPPPWGDQRRMADYQHDPWLNPTDEFGDRAVRLKMARVERWILADFCRQNEITFLGSPPDAVDECGYLSPEFHGDLLHANSKYGAVALEYVLAEVGGKQ